MARPTTLDRSWNPTQAAFATCLKVIQGSDRLATTDFDWPGGSSWRSWMRTIICCRTPWRVVWPVSRVNRNGGAVHSGWRLVNQQGDELGEAEPWHHAPFLDPRTCVLYSPVFLGAMLYRREWLERIGGFDSQFLMVQDVDFLLRLSLSGCPMTWLRRVTVCYRQHDNNITLNAPRQAHFQEAVLDSFFARPDLPIQIRGLEDQTRFNASVWTAWRLYYTGHTDQVVPALRRSLNHKSVPTEEIAREWVDRFASWLSPHRRDVAELRVLLPYLKIASGRMSWLCSWSLLSRDIMSPASICSLRAGLFEQAGWT
jgi:hypothetical protein